MTTIGKIQYNIAAMIASYKNDLLKEQTQLQRILRTHRFGCPNSSSETRSAILERISEINSELKLLYTDENQNRFIGVPEELGKVK